MKAKVNDNNRLHCEDGPAHINSQGDQEWYINGSLHREDGPAYISHDGHMEWWQNNKLHRIDGPAVVLTPKNLAWYVVGVAYGTNNDYQQAASITDEEMLAVVLKYGNIS